MRNMTKIVTKGLALLSLVALVGCSAAGGPAVADPDADKSPVGSDRQEINLYSDRHYDTDQQLYDLFTAGTGIQVNVVKATSDELIERLAREGAATEADLLITADAGRLHRAKSRGLLQPVTSDLLAANIPENLRDRDNEWFGLTMRGRVVVYAVDRVDSAELSTYDALTDPKWKGKILVRSSGNIYNQSLLASLIAIHGEDKARAWAEGIVANMARSPKGDDRDQARALVAGEGDLAIMNTYYLGKMLNSSDPEEVKVAQALRVFFPDQNGTGTHINISGIGLTKHSKHQENAIKFMEFLSSEEAQRQFAEANYEYPVNPRVEPSELLRSWGEFRKQDINLSQLGDLNAEAVKIFDQVGWK